MLILRPTDLYGKITYLGINPDRSKGQESIAISETRVGWHGFEGDCYATETRASCSRVRHQYQKGTEIMNARQLSILSKEELHDVATEMQIGAIRPEWVNANLVLEGIPDLTLLPPSSRLIFENGVSLVVDMQNGPCKYAAEVIDSHVTGNGLNFPKVAQNRRGVTARVERLGTLYIGERARLHIPPQRIYKYAL